MNFTGIKVEKFNEVNLEDSFFDTLKKDYEGFETWFERKWEEKCFIKTNDEGSIVGFLYLKEEEEEIELQQKVLPVRRRLKIGTFKLSDEIKGTKIGEAFFNIIFKTMYAKKFDEIYVTVFEKQKELIKMFESFGFCSIGKKGNGELVLTRGLITEGNIRKCYPYIKWGSNKGKYLIISEEWHDKLLPEARLKNVDQTTNYIVASNGISKVYISFAHDMENKYSKGDILAIYRKAKEDRQFKSVISSLGVCEEIIKVKSFNKKLITFEDYKRKVGNKSVFTEKELEDFYNEQKNLYIVKFIINIPFGEGNNVNYNTLKKNGLWGDGYPMGKNLTKEEVLKIIQLGGSNVQDIIID